MNGPALSSRACPHGRPWDPAYAALFLASDHARWISGHILTVDGGGMGRTAPKREPER
ncbi:SDR family oxidoreductase [Streptomyces sp. NPDC101234]|uniref:SDR family oxidoreductase n=1 Tax=Streptomyces sp. NPDC101234 TaxID=3366138 RepID=UPI003823A101